MSALSVYAAINAVSAALAKNGITVKGRARTIDWKYREVTPLDLSKYTELGFVESPPMKDIVREVFKPSQNLYAQLCLLQVGVWSQESRVKSQESAIPQAANSQPSAVGSQNSQHTIHNSQ